MFLKEERETILNYDPITQTWHAWTNYPSHILKFRKQGWSETQKWSENGRDIAATFTAPKTAVRIFNPAKIKNIGPGQGMDEEPTEDE